MVSELDTHEATLEFTGERFLPEVAGQIAFEHLHRYHVAAALCTGKRVLDVACGEGYGSNILRLATDDVTGVDIAEDAVAHARERYARDGLKFVVGSAAELPLPDGSVDVVVSFETIEHHDQHEEMLCEVLRVLRPGGLLIMSSPNKQYYTVEAEYHNPYHVKELFREELIALVSRHFTHVDIYSQRVVHGSLLVAEGGAARLEGITGLDGERSTRQPGLPRPLYDLVIASNGALPERTSSFFEMKVHGLDAASFYGVHLVERVNTADNRIAQLQAQLEAAEQRSAGVAAVGQWANGESTPDEISHARAMLGAVHAEVGQIRLGLAALAGEHGRGLGGIKLDLSDAVRQLAATHARNADVVRDELAEVRSHLQHTMEDRVSSLEKMLVESQGISNSSMSSIALLQQQVGDLQAQLVESSAERQRTEASVRDLQLTVTEQRSLLDEREKEIQMIRESRSWRYTGWIRALIGTARRPG